MRWKDASDYFAYLAIRLLICFAQAVRIETCAAMARGFATLLTRWIPLRANVIEENFRLAFPEMSAAERRQLTWRMWEHLILMVAEVAHAPRKIHATNWRDYIRIERMAEMMRLCFSGRPIVAVSGHFGNFELAIVLIGLFGIEIISVVRPIENRFLDDFVHRFRAAKGRKILQKTGSAGDINQHLAKGGFLSVLADQHAGAKGCWVDFFGHPASTHKAIALFSLTHDAPMIVGYVRRLRPATAVRDGDGRHRRPAAIAVVRSRRARADPVVHSRAGAHRAPQTGTILVGSPSLERHSTGKEKAASCLIELVGNLAAMSSLAGSSPPAQLFLAPHAPAIAQPVEHVLQPPDPLASAVPQPGPQPSLIVSANRRICAAES